MTLFPTIATKVQLVFDIRDEDKLNFVESQITIHKTAELANIKNFGELDFSHYKAIHKYLFNELYTWAGEIRTVNISKKRKGIVYILVI